MAAMMKDVPVLNNRYTRTEEEGGYLRQCILCLPLMCAFMKKNLIYNLNSHSSPSAIKQKTMAHICFLNSYYLNYMLLSSEEADHRHNVAKSQFLVSFGCKATHFCMLQFV